MNQSQSAAFASKARQKTVSKAKTTLNILEDEIEKIKPLLPKKQPPTGTPLMSETIPEGTKVRLNVERIFAQKDFASLQPRYKKFVFEARDKVFTVEYDPERTDKPSLVCLAEDKSEIKWLWHVSDLEVVA